MPLQDELDAVHRDVLAGAPVEAAEFDADTRELVRRGVGKDAPRVGDTAPEFDLPDQRGRAVRLGQLQTQGPLVISFYRGGWCPYCSLELRALQRHLPQMSGLGASLVAISPQIPDESLSTAGKHELSFPVLSDEGNRVARLYGLVFNVSEHLRPLYAAFGIDLPKVNGRDSFELPVPATFVIDRIGVIRAACVEADYKKRMEPTEILNVLAELK